MKIKWIILTALFFFVNTQMQATGEHLFYPPEENKSIVINNRILAKVNGKAISVYDIMKKMDMLFYRSFPEYTSSTTARFQFYQMNWKGVLRDLIDKELILADAEENKMVVSSGDVRQEMENLFGPNIIANLDSIGLTFEEAWKIVQGDILIKRMMYVRTTSKVLKQITPQDVHAAYAIYATENIRPDTWVYSVISIRDKDKTKGAEAAYQTYRLLAEDHVPLSEVSEKIKTLASIAKSSKVTISEEYRHNDKEMSEAYKITLTNLKPGTYSQPSTHKSRMDNSNIYRIFYLKEFLSGGALPFNEVAKQLKEKLLDEAADKETDEYLKRLRKHFDVQETLEGELSNEEFEPFRIF